MIVRRPTFVTGTSFPITQFHIILSQIFFPSNSPAREQRWSEVIERSLASVGPVLKVASQQLVGLLILVFAPADYVNQISDVSTTYLGTGTLGIGNKGATAVKLRLVWIHGRVF